ncbi:helix-turn-helix transcriptional regulator [Selenomonas sp. AB3002]|uniref:helix-turn-helix domain-containing protein n=1 Tax=Selenomonas sp. AB3002 TaxID=1392502 RepID=UPI00049603F9
MEPTVDEKKAMVGLNIGYYRRSRNMTQAELAEQIEVSSNFLSQVERGLKHLSMDKFFKVAEILKIDERLLLDFSRKQDFV